MKTKSKPKSKTKIDSKTAKNKVVLVSLKLSGPKADFKMTVPQIKEFVKLQIEDEELPFEITYIRVEVENKR